jgi:dihydroneopterin aldolase
LADHLATALLNKFPTTTKSEVEVRKLILPGTHHVAVRVERTHP